MAATATRDKRRASSNVPKLGRRMFPMTASIATFFSVLGCNNQPQARTVHYVDDDAAPGNGCTSWKDACPELQTALAMARPGDIIYVAAGVYRPDYDPKTGEHNGDRLETFHLHNGVQLYGGFAGYESSPERRAGL